MKKRNILKKLTPFAAGAASFAILIAAAVPASASGYNISLNEAGIRVYDAQMVKVGEGFTAANGQQVPSTLTYTDAAGGKTHYIAANQIAKLLDAEVEWSDKTNSVEFAPSSEPGNVIITVGKVEKPEDRVPDPDLVTVPEYGKIVGGLEEVDPATTPFINDVYHCCGGKAQDLRMQVHLGQFPAITDMAKSVPFSATHVVFTVTNHGKAEVYSEVRRVKTIGSGVIEDFTSVAVLPGETLTRVFRIVDGANPLETEMRYQVRTLMDYYNPDDDVTVSLMHYFEGEDLAYYGDYPEEVAAAREQAYKELGIE